MLDMQFGDSYAREKTNIVELLQERQPLKICAPMVRYSKLAFRTLVRKYGCDLAYTPMIISNSFVRSQKCRDIEFVTNKSDKPLIVQFAANNPIDFSSASEIVYPHVDGVDLNCGCPQRWSMAEGYGAKLLQKPELLYDIIRNARNLISDSNFSISAKIRILEDSRKTIDLCKGLENSGASFITVHGRTKKERHQPVHYDVIKLVKESISIPVVANGDVTSLSKLHEVHKKTGADGVMVARGILNNPALFDGYDHTPLQCINDWLEIFLSSETHFTCFHNHLIYMLKNITSKEHKQIFNYLKTKEAVLEYLQNNNLLELK